MTEVPKKIDIWRIPLNSSQIPSASLQGMLTPEEMARAARFRFSADRSRWVRTRAAVRTILGQTLRCSPCDIPLITNAYGKPQLLPGFHNKPLHFNWSHTEDLALLALSADGEVGIDVERLRMDFNPQALAQSVFSHNELACLRAAPAAGVYPLFFRFWTAKEALLKALGTGLAAPPADCCLAILAHQDSTAARGLTVRILPVGSAHESAVAFFPEDTVIYQHEWHE